MTSLLRRLHQKIIYQQAIFAMLCFMACFNVSWAMSPEAVGSISIAVSDESNEERWRANYLGLKEVMLRLSGSSDALETDQAKEILKQNARYLKQFSYDTVIKSQSPLFFEELDLGLGQTVDTSNIESIKVLKLTFDVNLLIVDMQKAGMTVWGLRRPEILFWWVHETEQGYREVVSELSGQSDQNFGSPSLLYYAEKRALPLRLPLMDLKDQSLVRVSDIWGGYGEALQLANARYNLDTWVVGKSYFADGEWQASWSLYLFDQQRAFKASSSNLQALQKRLINHLSELMAKEFSVTSGTEKSEIFLEVRNIDSIDKFNALNRYLNEIFLIEYLQLASVNGHQVKYKLVLKDGKEKLEKLFRLNRHLAPIKLQAAQTESVSAVNNENESTIPDKNKLTQNSSQQLFVLQYEWL